jgi:hypothetical protein
MLKEAGMTNTFWPEAHQYLNNVHNCSPTKALTRTTPHEVFYKKKPDVSTLRIFSSRCHVCIPKEKCKKLDLHSVDSIFCGFADQHKACSIWIPSRHKFTTSQDVIVYEKLPEHEIEPIITSASSEGVIQSESTTSKADNQNIVEIEQLPAEPQLLPFHPMNLIQKGNSQKWNSFSLALRRDLSRLPAMHISMWPGLGSACIVVHQEI